MKNMKKLKIFIFEENNNKETMHAIFDTYEGKETDLFFVDNSYSLVELMKFQPDILVVDYENNNILNFQNKRTKAVLN